VSLVSAARNKAKIKVRQPLAEVKIQPDNEFERRGLRRFTDQICEELNLKKVSLHDSTRGPLLTTQVKLNKKNAGPKLGSRLEVALGALAAANQDEMVRAVRAGKRVELPCPDSAIELEPDDIEVQYQGPPGEWVWVVDRDTHVLLNTQITQALAREG